MKNLSILLVLIAFFGLSCSSVAHKIFNQQSPRENYEDRIDDTPEGRQWIALSANVLHHPVNIGLPYSHKGYFDGKPRSLALSFSAKRGEKLSFHLDRYQARELKIFADIFKEGDPQSILSPDTTNATFSINVEEDGKYILRLQPELYLRGEYFLSISKGPSLGFPVSGNKARIGSFWGADRDGGKRSHEGIDIFAPKRTPVLAAEDGVITNVKEGGIGGKVVWLRTLENNLSLYYAHLDEQLVKTGQLVKKGEVIGLVGNTGNARTTPPHLHFGIYTYGGAIDPLAYVDRNEKSIPVLPKKNIAGNDLKLRKKQKLGEEIINANSVLVPLAVTSKGYIVELPGGKLMEAKFSEVVGG